MQILNLAKLPKELLQILLTCLLMHVRHHDDPAFNRAHGHSASCGAGFAGGGFGGRWWGGGDWIYVHFIGSHFLKESNCTDEKLDFTAALIELLKIRTLRKLTQDNTLGILKSRARDPKLLSSGHFH